MTRAIRTAVALAIAGALTAVLFVTAGEVTLRIAYPQVVMYPRWQPSLEYGLMLPKAAQMVHRRPGHWEFRYTINEYQCRGPLVPVSNTDPTRNIVVLGDSFSMGMGVNDGEEYPAVLGKQLGDRFSVINTATSGWGLPQQVRRYYEFGRLYVPAIVILQFCSNDPADGAQDQVTSFSNAEFQFHNTARNFNPIFNTLSKSRLVQSSQLYALFRTVNESGRDVVPAAGGNTDAESRAYVELLAPFAGDLHGRGVRLLVISVNGQLDVYPRIKDQIMSLHAEGMLEYIEVADWFDAREYPSPEGHAWGATAHRIIDEKLAEIVRRD